MAKRLGVDTIEATLRLTKTCTICGHFPIPARKYRYCSQACYLAGQLVIDRESARRSQAAKCVVLRLTRHERSALYTAARIRGMDAHALAKETVMSLVTETLARPRKR